MNWKQFDANEPNNKRINEIKNIGRSFFSILKSFDEKTTIECIIQGFINGEREPLKKVIGVDIFSPNEFDSFSKNDDSLQKLANWLTHQNIDWEGGSKTLQRKIDEAFEIIDNKKIDGGRSYVILDNLINIDDNKIAIEIETSNNLDNGYYTLRQAIKNKHADYGIMIVPWIEVASGRANEGKALSRLDNEFDGKKDLEEGAIYRIAPIRIIDSLLMIENE